MEKKEKYQIPEIEVLESELDCIVAEGVSGAGLDEENPEDFA
jgi:hypothetical protein